MRHRKIIATAVLLAGLLGAFATARSRHRLPQDAGAGQFDHFVLSLSWSPEYCASTERDATDPQCGSSRRYGFVVHGLWPQHESGFLESCAAGGRLDQSIVDGMLDIMPSPTLIRHEWKTHGTCSGMPPADYFAKVRAAYTSVHIPEPYQNPQGVRHIDANRIRREFLQANSGFDDDDLAVVCSQRYLHEVRICLDKELRPLACGRDVRDRCRGEVVVRPVR